MLIRKIIAPICNLDNYMLQSTADDQSQYTESRASNENKYSLPALLLGEDRQHLSAVEPSPLQKQISMLENHVE